MGARSGKHGRVACKSSPHYQAANSTMGGKIFTGESCFFTGLVYGAGCGGSQKRRARAKGVETTFRLSPPKKRKQRKGSTRVL
ncbi:hypothetical protein E5D57_013192 [Metarhizium anisopliae]|nr:hypothetical protein E5D57_013192 [Metarhizium anisopliae]